MADVEREARQSERTHFFAEVDVLRHGTPKPLRMWGENLSESGIFLQTSQPWTVGERVALRIPVCDERVVIRQAEVAWVRPFEPISVDGRLPGIGVRFLAADPPYRAAIRQLMGRARAEAPTTPPTSVRDDDGACFSVSFVDENEHTLRGWSFEKAPRATAPRHREASVDESSRSPHVAVSSGASANERASSDTPSRGTLRFAAPIDDDVTGPSVLGTTADDDSARWQLGAPSGALAVAHHEASRAPVAVDTSLPALAHTDSARHRELDGAIVHHAVEDDAVGDDERARIGAALTIDDETPTVSLRASRTVEEHVPFRLVVKEGQHDDEGTFVPRRVTKARTPSFALAASVVLVGVGLGVALGLKEVPEPNEPRIAEAPRAPRSVDEVERDLHALIDESASGHVARLEARPVTAETPVSGARAPDVRPTSSDEQSAPTATPTPTLSSARAASPRHTAEPTSTEGLLPRKPVASESVMTSAVVAPRDALAAPEPKPTGGPVVERGRVTLPIEGGVVKSAFTLDGPPRVVVDLEETALTSFREIPVAEKGISKIRLGKPSPGTVRVVVELEPGARPRDVTTLKQTSTLAVAWR